MLAEFKVKIPVVVAGNKAATDEIENILKEAGIDGVEAYDIAKASIPMGIIAIILAAIKNYMFDKKIKVKKGDING